MQKRFVSTNDVTSEDEEFARRINNTSAAWRHHFLAREVAQHRLDTVDDERVAIIQWLTQMSDNDCDEGNYIDRYAIAAEAIRAGDHRKDVISTVTKAHSQMIIVERLESCAEDQWGELACEAAGVIVGQQLELERLRRVVASSGTEYMPAVIFRGTTQ